MQKWIRRHRFFPGLEGKIIEQSNLQPLCPHKIDTLLVEVGQSQLTGNHLEQQSHLLAVAQPRGHVKKLRNLHRSDEVLVVHISTEQFRNKFENWFWLLR